MVYLCQSQMVQCVTQLGKMVSSFSLRGGHPSEIMDVIQDVESLVDKVPGHQALTSWHEVAAHHRLNERLMSEQYRPSTVKQMKGQSAGLRDSWQ